MSFLQLISVGFMNNRTPQGCRE